MKKALLLTVLLVIAWTARAGDDVSDFRGRVSVGVEGKLVRGLTLSVEEEFRFSNKWTTFDRIHSTLGLQYKVCPYFYVGAGFTMINNFKPSTRTWVHKERVYLDLTGRYKVGIATFTLRERLQMTHRNGNYNRTETTPNLLALKSRFKVKLDFGALEPYAAFEVRNIFNGPTGTVGDFDEEEGMYSYVHTGYTNKYFDRFRANAGLVWKITKHHALDLYFIGDYVQYVTIDTDRTQQFLKSRTVDRGFISTLGLGYTFRF